jgi:hypothetical protein
MLSDDSSQVFDQRRCTSTHPLSRASTERRHLAQIAASSSITRTCTLVGVDSLDATASAVIELVLYASERDRGAVSPLSKRRGAPIRGPRRRTWA